MGFEALSSKIREILEGAEREVVKVAIETLFKKGVIIETENLEVDVKDSKGNPVLKIAFKGKISVKTVEG